jgi:acyl-CoA synthetase (AMP-forming)/AMP-acid ligase II
MADFDYWCEVSPVADLLVRGACLNPDRDAIVLPNQRRSYKVLLEGAVRVARGLLALDVKPGEHVGLMTTNSPEYVEGFFGILLLGCVAVPINARHKASELGYIVDNSQLVALLTTADPDEYVDFSEVLRKALPSLASAQTPTSLSLQEAPSLRCTVLLRGKDREGFLGRDVFDRLAEKIDPALVEQARMRVCIRQTALIIYTSGTTANPKGCMLSHEAVTRGPTERARHRLATGGHDVHWGAGPLFHIGTLSPFIGTIGALGTYLTDTVFEPGRALELMVREKVTTAWPWFQAIMLGLIDHPSFDPDKLKSLRSLFLISPSVLVDRVQSLLPATEVIQGCGMTETAGIFALADRDESREQRSTTQGKAATGVEVRILSLDGGRDARADEVGEILVRGYCVMDGYYHDPVKTAEALDADGWLHTGDLYSKTVDGSLVFNGRLKDMLKVGGENVAAIEVEAFLCEHPEVNLAAVIGMADDRLEEVPVAFVELRRGSNLQSEELISFCKGRIANYKIPRAVYFVQPEEWPMSATKIQKQVLKVRLQEILGK